MDAPWRVCAVERQHRDRQASLAHPFDSVDGRFDLQLTWFAGVDWWFQKHQACVLDDAGKVLGEQEFEHGGARLSEMANWLLSFAAGEAGEVGVTTETPLAKWWGVLLLDRGRLFLRCQSESGPYPALVACLGVVTLYEQTGSSGLFCIWFCSVRRSLDSC